MTEKLTENLIGIECMSKDCHESSSYIFSYEISKEEYLNGSSNLEDLPYKEAREILAQEYSPNEIQVSFCNKHFHLYCKDNEILYRISIDEKRLNKYEFLFSNGYGLKLKSNYLLQLESKRKKVTHWNFDKMINNEKERKITHACFVGGLLLAQDAIITQLIRESKEAKIRVIK